MIRRKFLGFRFGHFNTCSKCQFIGDNFKDGNATLSDPMVMQFTYVKINNKWKVINAVETSVRQDVKTIES